MKKNWTIDDFEIGRPLGRGNFGRVFLAREKKHGYIVALKIIKKSSVRDQSQARLIRREIEIHTHLVSEYILRMFGYFHDSENLYLILEYAGGGELFLDLQNCQRYSESKTAKYIYQVLKALETMHQMNVIHRDIKPENILIGCDGNLKIADFGYAVCDRDRKRYTFCGTPEYLAPEIVNKEKHNQKVDIWCVGILCFEFLTGSSPFEKRGHSQREILKSINTGYYNIPVYVSNTARDFIESILVPDVNKRPEIKDLLKHPFIVGNLKHERSL
ncbi:putative spindle assembly checkpoint kinase like protein [Dictyocoela muelleri]|nr:putative spindle assembly checkpoint kinase like protein [Dictyocoela muelleri]